MTPPDHVPATVWRGSSRRRWASARGATPDQTALVLHPRPASMPVGCRLVHAADTEEFFFLERWGEELQADWQTGLREAAWDAETRDAGEVAANRVHVREVHRQGILGLLAGAERGG